MRPDDHKKRKNTQYKKKHGITNKTDLKEKTSTERSDKDKSKQLQKTEIKTSSLKQNDQKQDPTTAKSYDEGAGKQFSRRHVVSNWSRYDELSTDDSDDDVPTQRGEDFNKLLAQAGGSAAQFRFKDEEDWTADGGGETTAGILALDLDSLSQSLVCVPLHERLGLEQHLFSLAQNEEMTTEAKKNNDKYEQAQKHIPHKKPVKTSAQSHSTINKPRITHESNIPNDNCTLAGQSETKAGHIHNTIQNDIQTLQCDKTNVNGMIDNLLSEKAMNSKDSGTKTQSSVTTPVANTITKTKDVLDLEDDLDALLELNDSMSTLTKVPFLDAHRKPVTDTSVKPPGLKAVPISKISAQNTKPSVTESNKKTDDNLENWLDNMLDD